MKGYRKIKKENEELEYKYMALLAEKMDLEYKCRELEDQCRHEREQSEEILRLHENARRLKHDMKNHVMVIASFLQDEQAEEAKQYLSKIMDRLNGMYTYIETGNSLLSHIINAKLELAHNNGITIKAKIENLSLSVMESVDFSAVLSNILDNAIETKSSIHPEIEVEIVKKRAYDTILVKNRIDVSVLTSNPQLHSVKSQKEYHGIGIRQVKEIVSKYDGLCDFYEENQMFCVCVMIPSV